MSMSVSSQSAIPSASVTASSPLTSISMEFSLLTAPMTGLGHPMARTILSEFSLFVRKLRKATAWSGCFVLAETMNPSGAPVRNFGLPGVPSMDGIAKKPQFPAIFSSMSRNSSSST